MITIIILLCTENLKSILFGFSASVLLTLPLAMFLPEVYLFTSLFLFSAGISVFLVKKNAIVMLIGIELMLNAANLNLVGFNQLYAAQANGQAFSLFVIVVAAAEAAVALAIILKVYQYYNTAEPDDINEIKEQ